MSCIRLSCQETTSAADIYPGASPSDVEKQITKKIEDVTEEVRELSTYNGQPVIGLSINKRSDSNTVKISGDALKNITLGILLTSIFLFLFLHNWRQILIAASLHFLLFRLYIP